MLHGRRALVTGGSRGIGLGIVRALAAEGVKVSFCGRDRDVGVQAEAELRAEHHDATFIAGDLMTDAGVDDVVAAASRMGSIDILVNNVGGANDPDAGSRPFEQIPSQDWVGTFQKCLLGAARLTAQLLEPMRAGGWGRIINISSTSGLEPGFIPADYAAAKAALNTMTVSLAQSIAKTGVTANVVSPGPILTDAMRSYIDFIASQRGWEGDFKEKEVRFLAEVMPLKTARIGRPEDVGAAVAFIASPCADYITGAHLRIDGGLSQAAI